MFQFKFLPGWMYLVVIGLVSTFLSTIVEIGGKHPIESSVVAIIFGVILRNLNLIPEICRDGVKASETLLIYGIILVGASLNAADVVSQGVAILAIIIATMIVGYIVVYQLSRFWSLPRELSILLAIGTTICGGTAIAVVAPLIRAKEEETSYAVGTISLWGLAAILLYPQIAASFGVSDLDFGVFAGTAIHSTPQVVGAGFIFSELAGKTATAVKLVRNCFMAPAALLITVWYTRRVLHNSNEPHVNVARAFPWFLFGYFVMAWLNSRGYFTQHGIESFTDAGKFLILLGMAGVGLNTDLGAFKRVGYKPLLVGLVGSVVVACTSILGIRLLL